jgi:proteasome lid subunit RPN8/RPN11
VLITEDSYVYGVHFRFSREQFEQIIERATITAEDGGREICGLLIYNGAVIDIRETKNTLDCGGGFVFDPLEIRAIEDDAEVKGHEVLGAFHSHPLAGPMPGQSDIEHALDDSIMLVIDCGDKEAKLWYILDQQKYELEFELI